MAIASAQKDFGSFDSSNMAFARVDSVWFIRSAKPFCSGVYSSIGSKLVSEHFVGVLSPSVTSDELDIGFGEVFLSYFSMKKSFDVCLPLVVDSQHLTLVFHEVHPREVGEVVYNDNPVSVAFPRFWSYWASNIHMYHLKWASGARSILEFKR